MPFLEGVKGDEFAFFYSFVRFCRYFRCEYEKNVLNLQKNNEKVDYELTLLPIALLCARPAYGGLQHSTAMQLRMMIRLR